MTGTLTEMAPLRRPGQLVTVAAHRARRLSVIGQPNTRLAAVLGWFALVAMWGVNMAGAGVTAGQIRILGSASAALEGKPKAPRQPAMVAVGLAGYLLFVCVFAVPLAVELVDPSALPGWLLVVHVLFAANFLVVAIIELFARLVRSIREPESRDGSLRARRDELGTPGAPAYFAVGLVAGRRKRCDGERLFAALQDQLRTEHAVAVFYPADKGLVGLYASWGARMDDGARRRMLLECR